MAKIEALTANPAAAAGRFVDAEGKAELAGQPLRIVGVKDDPRNLFGARWLISVVVLSTGEKVALGLAHNDARNSMFPGIAEAIEDDGPEGIEPVVLYRQAPTKGGNAFWNFRTASDEELAGLDAEGETESEAEADSAADDLLENAEPAAPILRSHRARAAK